MQRERNKERKINRKEKRQIGHVRNTIRDHVDWPLLMLGTRPLLRAEKATR
jgi:hypothetical protein